MNHQHILTWQERRAARSEWVGAETALADDVFRDEEIADCRARITELEERNAALEEKCTLFAASLNKADGRIAELEAAALAVQPGELPPLPEGKFYDTPAGPEIRFSTKQMQAYARATLAAVQPAAPQEPQTKPILMAYCATDLDGHADVAMTIEEAKRRAGPSCDTIIALHDISINYVELEGKAVGKPLTATTTPDAVAVRDGWISAGDRLPEKGTSVLVFYPRDPAEPYRIDMWDEWHEDPIGMGGATICTGEGWMCHDDEGIEYWHPLPASPADVRAMGEPGASPAVLEGKPD